ncbi:MAG: DUF922 domain-containing protein [Rhizobiaceae bacterium]
MHPSPHSMLLSPLKAWTGLLVCVMVLAGCQSTQQSSVSVDYYKISGDSTAALDSEIRKKGPKLNGGLHAIAIARIKMFPNISYKRTNKGCEIADAKVAVDAKVTLPKWTGRETASGEMGEAWDNIDRYTRLHEATHVNIAFSYARKIEKSVLALKPVANCGDMRAITKRIVDNHLQDHDKAQKQFDADEQARFSMLAKREPKN